MQYTILVVLVLIVLITFVIYQLTKPFSQLVKDYQRFKVTATKDETYIIKDLEGTYVKRMAIKVLCADADPLQLTVTVNNQSQSLTVMPGQSYVIDEFTDGMQLDLQHVTLTINANAVLDVGISTIRPSMINQTL